MTIENDLSLNTVIVSAMIAGGAWVLRNGVTLLIESIKLGIKYAAELIGKMQVLDSKMTDFLNRTNDHEKLRADVNEYYKQLRKLKAEVDELRQPEI